LSAEFSRYLFDHPEVQDELPLGCEIILLPEFDEELKEYNKRLGEDMADRNEKVVFVVIKEIRPKSLSRIQKIELRSVA
jgi:hypothetical protein